MSKRHISFNCIWDEDNQQQPGTEVSGRYTRPKASGSSSRFQGGGVTGKGQDRDEINTRQGRDKDKTGAR